MELVVLAHLLVVTKRQAERARHAQAGGHHLQVDAMATQIAEGQGAIAFDRFGLARAVFALTAEPIEVLGQPGGQGFIRGVVIGLWHAAAQAETAGWQFTQCHQGQAQDHGEHATQPGKQHNPEPHQHAGAAGSAPPQRPACQQGAEQGGELVAHEHDLQWREQPRPGAFSLDLEERDEGIEQGAHCRGRLEQRQQLGAMAIRGGHAEVLGQSFDFREPGWVAAQLTLLIALAAQFGSCRCCRGDGASAGTADAAQTKRLGDFGDGQRVDDATGDAAFHDQVAFPGKGRLARIAHLLLLVVMPNAGAGMITRLLGLYASIASEHRRQAET